MWHCVACGGEGCPRREPRAEWTDRIKEKGSGRCVARRMDMERSMHANQSCYGDGCINGREMHALAVGGDATP